MALYEDAFPSEERRDFADLMRLLEERECMHALSLEVSGRFVGFSVYWDFRDFLFLEHLAIVPRWRGQGIGGYFLDELARIRPVFHLLEAEPPAAVPWPPAALEVIAAMVLRSFQEITCSLPIGRGRLRSRCG